MASEPGARRAWLGMPAGIWALGGVSLLADIASEMVHSLLPVFLLGLGTSVAMIGLIEGVAESTALMVKADSADPKVYLPVLAKTDGYKGVTGTIAFDEKGDIKNGALTLYTYKGDKREQIAVVR